MSAATQRNINFRLLPGPAKAATRALLLLLGVAITLAACSGAAGEDDDSSRVSTAAGSSISGCTGRYTCVLYGPPFGDSGPDEYWGEFDGRLVRKDGACLWQSADDATKVVDLSQATVKGTTFKLHGVPYDYSGSGNEYLFCWPPDASCGGSATSCYSVGLSDCAYQDGCSQNLHSLFSLNDDACEGVPRSCSTVRDERDCYRLFGCVWQ